MPPCFRTIPTPRPLQSRSSKVGLVCIVFVTSLYSLCKLATSPFLSPRCPSGPDPPSPPIPRPGPKGPPPNQALPNLLFSGPGSKVALRSGLAQPSIFRTWFKGCAQIRPCRTFYFQDLIQRLRSDQALPNLLFAKPSKDWICSTFKGLDLPNLLFSRPDSKVALRSGLAQPSICSTVKGLDLLNLQRFGFAEPSLCQTVKGLDLLNLQRFGFAEPSLCQTVKGLDLLNLQRIGFAQPSKVWISPIFKALDLLNLRSHAIAQVPHDAPAYF